MEVADRADADPFGQLEDLGDGECRTLFGMLGAGPAHLARVAGRSLCSTPAVISTARSSRYALAREVAPTPLLARVVSLSRIIGVLRLLRLTPPR
ncbi:hypothetical protein [Actinomadura rugatobispora]|uniref:HTH luxR-type domain-containing protein n=1 Tax=Actinomadura rugatobispora TaxID=1994 RepID=A0ABW1AH30_9ACTN|nr:hypothetical protein GCM10010200_046530 [Actinomadura rugatobispora]